MAGKMTPQEEIEHFLRLAIDPAASQHERDLASARAERLMIKHAIDRAMIDATGVQGEKIIMRDFKIYGSKSSYSWDKTYGFADVVEAMGLYATVVDYRFMSLSKGHPDKAHVVLRIYGFESDMDDCLALLNNLSAGVMIALKQFWADNAYVRMLGREEGFAAKHEFVKHFGYGAAARIRDERKTAIDDSAPGTGLVMVSREEKVRQEALANAKGTLKGNRDRSGLGRDAGHRAGYQAAAGKRPAVSAQRAISG